MNQLILTNPPKRLSRDEMNLAEFPLSVLSTRSNPKTKTLEFSDFVRNKNGDLVDRKWIITGADKFGLPTASDDEVLLGLLKLTVDDGMRSNKVYFTRYEILKTLKWTTEGRSYTRLQKALDRLSGVRIKASNAFYDNETKLHSTKNFGILDAYEINDGRDNDAKKSFFIWSEVLFKSFQVGFIKKLDLDFYLNLKSAVSKRIYRYLDKHFWYRSKVQMNVFIFAHEKIGISRNYRFLSQIRQQIDPAIEELITAGFITGCEYIGKGSSAEISIYVAKGQEISKNNGSRSVSIGDSYIVASKTKPLEENKSKVESIYESAFRLLSERGIRKQQLDNLLRNRSEEMLNRIISIIEYFDRLIAMDSTLVSRSPIGFLYRAVENPESFVLPGEAPKRMQQAGLPFMDTNNLEHKCKPSVSPINITKPKSLESDYLVERKKRIRELKVEVEPEILEKIVKEVKDAISKLRGLISDSRFNEAIEHGVEERLAKLFALPDFEEWSRSKR